MRRRLVMSVLLACASCTGSIASLFRHQWVSSQEQLRSVPIGWPLTFLHQDLSEYTPMVWPQWFRFEAPQHHPVTVDIGLLVANTAAWGAGLYVLWRVIVVFRKRLR